MSNRFANYKSHISETHGFPISEWSPLEAALRWNSLAFGAYSTIVSEAQDFVARRLNEDFALLRRLAHCPGHHAALVAYTDFCRKAAEDYGREATTMGKLMINTASKMVTAAQSGNDEEECAPALLREAAE